MGVIQALSRRDDFNDGYDGGWWYYSTTALIIKWVITGVIVVALLGFVVGGWFHLQRRIKKGLPPKRYHAWLMSREQRARYYPQAGQVYYHPQPYGQQGPGMPMQPWGPAPPAYGEQEYVPPYAPPEGGSKVNPNQQYDAPPPNGPSASSYQPPSHPPPAAR